MDTDLTKTPILTPIPKNPHSTPHRYCRLIKIFTCIF